MASRSGHVVFHLLVSSGEIRGYLFGLLQRDRCRPVVRAGLDELLSALKGKRGAIVLLDSEAVAAYGASIYSKIKAADPESRVILLCDQAHRDLIKGAMEQGSYGCILEPYSEWEVSTMVKHILSDTQPGKRRSARSGKSP